MKKKRRISFKQANATVNQTQPIHRPLNNNDDNTYTSAHRPLRHGPDHVGGGQVEAGRGREGGLEVVGGGQVEAGGRDVGNAAERRRERGLEIVEAAAHAQPAAQRAHLGVVGGAVVRVGAVGQVPAAHGAEALRGHVRGHGVVHGRVKVGAGEVGEGLVAQEVHGSHASLRLLLGLGGHLAVAGLNPVLLHRQWAVDLPTGTTQRGEHNNNNVKKKKKNKNKEEEGWKNKTGL